MRTRLLALIKEQFLDKNNFVLSRVILQKATARILYPRIYILSTIKLYYFYNRVFDTAQADYSRREMVIRPLQFQTISS